MFENILGNAALVHQIKCRCLILVYSSCHKFLYCIFLLRYQVEYFEWYPLDTICEHFHIWSPTKSSTIHVNFVHLTVLIFQSKRDQMSRFEDIKNLPRYQSCLHDWHRTLSWSKYLVRYWRDCLPLCDARCYLGKLVLLQTGRKSLPSKDQSCQMPSAAHTK